MPEIKTAGYRGWWPIRLYQGKDPYGRKLSKEVFRNMVNGEIHDPSDKGWDGEPPYPTGGPIGISVNDLYRMNYDLIRWEKVN